MEILTPHQKAALNFKNHISLSANAGSGKTLVLSRRFLEIALTENISLRNIAAITFTDKAASELYKKIALQIDQKIIESRDASVIKKLESLRRELVSANISTIHSFCINILKEYPIEAGIDANFIPIDEILSNELIELSIEEVIKESIKNRDGENELKYLIRMFASRNIFTKELISLIKNRKNVFSLAEGIYSKPIEEIADFFYNSFIQLTETILFPKKDRLINYLEKAIQASLNDFYRNQTAIELKAKLAELKEKKSVEDFITIITEIKSLSCTNDGKLLARFVNSNLRKNLGTACDELENIFAELKYFPVPFNHRVVELELARFGKSILYFFEKALNRYEEKKKENGYLDFEDILLFTQHILENQSVREVLSDKYKYIMIDEYQDTNELQFNIFLPILDYLRKGNLFVVGDEKQSIYMFRDAELEIFDRTKKEIVGRIHDSSGNENILTLPDSFRMAPKLSLFTNYLFKNLFSEPDILYNEVEHSDLVCARYDEVEGNVEILIADSEKDDCAEAELVAKRIIQLKNEISNFKWNSTAVLCRKRKSFSELEKSFIKYKIPFTIVGGKGFYQRQSIYDIYNYFSFLLDKGNDTALIGILRSPFFSFSDAEIFEVSLQPGKLYWDKLHSFCEKNISLMPAYKSLEENLKLASSLDVTRLLRKILNESAYLSVLASKPNSVQELANIEKLISLTTNFMLHGFKTLYDYVDFLEDSINELEDESQAVISDESNSVRIMTIHQAKGLEYPYVFLFKCDEFSQKDSVKTKEIFVNKKLGLLTKVPVNGNYFLPYESAPIIGVNNLISEKKNLAEIKRLFYVAVTRAKDQLFISASFKKNNKYPKESFMNLLIEGLSPLIDEELIVPSFVIKSNLKFLKKKDDKFINEEKELSLTIPIVKEIDLIQEENIEEKANEKKRFSEELLSGKIRNIYDQPEGEFISATKVAVYKQCPLKYYLTYHAGLSPLIKSYKKWIREKSNDKARKRYEFNDKENDVESISSKNENDFNIRGFAEIKGRVIHKILQNETLLNDLNNNLMWLEVEIKKEISLLELEKRELILLKEEILKDVSFFYESSTFKYLKSLVPFNNEFEIYSAEKDYFLYGIIDKLVIEDDKAYIFDYKTDDITEAEISIRSASYLNQLKFYSYIVSKLFKNISEFELNLIYIKHPDVKVTETLSKNDLLVIKKDLDEMVKNIRNEEFEKNLNHCPDCSFALNRGQCIKD